MIKFFEIICKSEKNFFKFGDTEIEKQILPRQKPYSINNKDITKIVVSKKVSFSKKGFKYFAGYKDGKK